MAELGFIFSSRCLGRCQPNTSLASSSLCLSWNDETPPVEEFGSEGLGGRQSADIRPSPSLIFLAPYSRAPQLKGFQPVKSAPDSWLNPTTTSSTSSVPSPSSSIATLPPEQRGCHVAGSTCTRFRPEPPQEQAGSSVGPHRVSPLPETNIGNFPESSMLCESAEVYPTFPPTSCPSLSFIFPSNSNA